MGTIFSSECAALTFGTTYYKVYLQPMRYIGSKSKIINFIDKAITECVGEINGKVFCDLFSGTVSVAKHFNQKGCVILSNDYMSFSHALQVAYLQFARVPTFSKITEVDGYRGVIAKLNSLEGVEGFFYKNYSPEGSGSGPICRNYFSANNAKKIDAILFQISTWVKSGLITKKEELLLRAILINEVTKVSNTSGTYGAFLKIDDNRKFNPLVLKPITSHSINNDKNKCFNEDALTLIDKIQGDILYLDPPYNSRQYPPYYHILETITLDDNPNIYGITGRRPYKELLSPFCFKGMVMDAFKTILDKANFQHIFISYSTEGLAKIEELVLLLNKYGDVEIFNQEYRRYKSNGNGNLTAQLKEVIIYVKKTHK